jgi:hypothetical protein
VHEQAIALALAGRLEKARPIVGQGLELNPGVDARSMHAFTKFARGVEEFHTKWARDEASRRPVIKCRRSGRSSIILFSCGISLSHIRPPPQLLTDHRREAAWQRHGRSYIKSRHMV